MQQKEELQKMLNIKSFLAHLPKVGDTLTVVGQRNRDEIKGTATVVDVKLNDKRDYEVRGNSIDNVAIATVRLNDTKIFKGKEFDTKINFFEWNGMKFINVILYTRQYALKTIDF